MQESRYSNESVAFCNEVVRIFRAYFGEFSPFCFGQVRRVGHYVRVPGSVQGRLMTLKTLRTFLTYVYFHIDIDPIALFNETIEVFINNTPPTLCTCIEVIYRLIHFFAIIFKVLRSFTVLNELMHILAYRYFLRVYHTIKA